MKFTNLPKKRGGSSGSAGITRTTSLKNKSVGNYRRTRRNTEDNLNFGDIPEQGNLIGDTDKETIKKEETHICLLCSLH